MLSLLIPTGTAQQGRAAAQVQNEQREKANLLKIREQNLRERERVLIERELVMLQPVPSKRKHKKGKRYVSQISQKILHNISYIYLLEQTTADIAAHGLPAHDYGCTRQGGTAGITFLLRIAHRGT